MPDEYNLHLLISIARANLLELSVQWLQSKSAHKEDEVRS